MPLGTIIEQETNVAPTYGVWLPCDNREIDVHEYPEYYAAKGSPALTSEPTLLAPLGKFRVPDRRGRVAVSVGSGYVLGATGGAATVSLTAAQNGPHTHNAKHSHDIIDPEHSHDLPVNAGTQEGQQAWREGGTPYSDNFNSARSTTGITVKENDFQTGSTGSGEAHNNMQPYIVHNHFVRVK